MKPQTKNNKQKLHFRNAVFAVTYRKNPETKQIEYLLLKRKLHWIGWEFPKGGIEKNENTKAAVRREVYEETGNRPLKISRYPITGKYRYPKMFADRPGVIGQNYTLWSAEIPSSRKIRLDIKEHSAYIWAPFNKAIRMLTHKNQKKCLAFVNKKLFQN